MARALNAGLRPGLGLYLSMLSLQAGFWEAEKTVPRGGGNQRPLNISEADWPAERSQQEHEASTSRKPLHRPWNTDVVRYCPTSPRRQMYVVVAVW